MRATATVFVCVLAGCGSTTVATGRDAAVMDASAIDVPSGFDAYLVDLRFIFDAGPMDVTDAATPVDVIGVDAGAACGMEPTAAVPSTVVMAGNGAGAVFAFDGEGNVAYAGGGQAVLVAQDGGVTRLSTSVPGTVVAARFAPDTELVLAVNGVASAGGEIVAIDPSTMTQRVVVASLGQAGGLAIDAYGYVWFSDTTTGAVYRQLLTDPTTLPMEVLTDVPSPGLLAFDNAGATLYVTSAVAGAAAGIDAVALTWGAEGRSVMAGAPVQLAGASPLLNGAPTGLAVDACENVYVIDQVRNQIWRIPPPPSTAFLVIVTDVTAPTGLAFGQGAGFSDTSLYTLDAMGALHAVNVGVPGVPLPLP